MPTSTAAGLSSSHEAHAFLLSVSRSVYQSHRVHRAVQTGHKLVTVLCPRLPTAGIIGLIISIPVTCAPLFKAEKKPVESLVY